MILCVDDDPRVREVTRVTLERTGYRVREASGGEEAIAAVERAPGDFALVILDWLMPGPAVDLIIRRLKEIHPGPKILLTSGYDRASVMTTPDRRAVDGFLQKPYGRQQLTQAVNRALKNHTPRLSAGS